MNRLTTETSVMGRKHDIKWGSAAVWKRKIKNDRYELIEEVVDKLGQLEDIEEKLKIDLVTLFKAIENGFYYIKNNEIHFCRWCIRVGNYLFEVKPCYAVKETTLQSCYYGDVSELKQTKDAHYWDWDTSLYVDLKDYGKTWTLTKEEFNV